MLNVGDVVRLNSSELPMTIMFFQNTTGGKRYVRCNWLDNNGNSQSFDYPEDSLSKYPNIELVNFHKSEERRKDAIAGATFFDKLSKITGLISAVGVAFLSVISAIQNSKLSEIENLIKSYSNTYFELNEQIHK